ncbi:hypothetical protein SAMN05660748_4237 [Blastococcus aggregatus]|uniref:Uncharacterized protein n=1 Tax=Blastococcus aggregatus TaxID=38502 RepID=A0A285VFR4_9ACTN|nr:hypothetical protein [Blastococcus aggregatus]SOC52910.1 hypothetical protein SAMN05660748_4237 [Blastococcus aggregatus]
MLKYDLQRLGGIGFQDVVSALAIKVLGAHVRPMGRGKDGGRDMLVNNGVIVWAANDHYAKVETWDGTTVFQAKHKQILEAPQRDASTLWQHIKAELNAWASPDSERSAVPHYLVFATNIPLTPAHRGGGFDTINANIQRFLDDLSDETSEDHLDGAEKSRARRVRQARRDRMRSLRAWRLWDGNQLVGLLDAHDGVRRAFDGFLTAGDVLADLSMLSTNLNQQELGPALKEHARWALLAERGVYFDDAGGESKGVPVEQVAIDLPVLVGDGQATERVIRYVLDRGDHVLKPTMTTSQKPRHLVVTGAPGNGKSTIAKFLTHAYRAAFVGESTDLGDEHQATVAKTEAALKRMGRAVPANRRWPVNVDLAKFAIAQATNSDYTLLHWIASHLTRQVTSKDVPRWGLWAWLRTWPSFIVLDGLDEVTEPSVRQTLVADIEAFVGDAESKDCDLLVMVTTRPTGYADEMNPTIFERINLTDLTIDDALQYGRLVTRVRVPNDETRRNGIIALLEEAARQEALKHLLRTPLQTLIMSIIAESSRRFSPSRFALFWGYYKVIEQREQNKELGYSRLLRDYAPQVLDLHLRVGLLLHERAETTTGSDAILTPEGLRDMAWQVLNDAGYEPSNKDRPLLDRILSAATHRLVLLTPQPGGGYGYDVRSLQELMAAYALTTGTLELAIPRLRRIGASPHWRNTLLFAAGRYFSEPQPHQKNAVTSLVLTLDENASDRLGAIFPVGPNVAIEVIDDGMASEPRYLHPLMTHALKAIHEPEGFSPDIYARMLMSAATASETVRRLIADGLREALSGTSVSRMNAEDVQRSITNIGKEVGTTPDVLGLATVKRDHSRSLPDDPKPDWKAFWDTIHAYSDPATAEVLSTIGDLLQRVADQGVTHDWAPLDLRTHLSDPDVAFILQEALSHVADASPLLVAMLRHDVVPTLWRQPVDLTDDPL